jgi:hypothetical protein
LSSLRVQDVAGPLGKFPKKSRVLELYLILTFNFLTARLYRVYPGKKADAEQDGYYLKIEVSHVKPENGHKESTDESSEETVAETMAQMDNEARKTKHSEEISQVEINPEERLSKPIT